MAASSVYVRDPDGNLIEFMTYPDASKEHEMAAELVIRGGTVSTGAAKPAVWPTWPSPAA